MKTRTFSWLAVCLLSWSISTAVLAGAASDLARAARSSQPILASVGAAAAGLDPASLATLRRVSRRADAAVLPSARTRAVRSEYHSRSAPDGSTRSVSARRCGSSTLTSLRRCLIITSAVRFLSAATFLGSVSGAAEPAPCAARNCAAVPSSPGATRLTISYRSCSRFSTGVAVSSSRCRDRSSRISFPEALRGARTRCASSTMIRSHGSPVSVDLSGSRRAAASEASTTGRSAPAAPASRRWAAGSRPARTVGIPNLRSSSSCHWVTSPAGVMTSARPASPRSLSSARISPASMVLPSPTSSARIARPRIRRNALRAACIW